MYKSQLATVDQRAFHSTARDGAATSERHAVVVVDDDPAVLRSVARMLSSNGYSPVTYNSPSTLLDDAAGLDVCCIIADLSMPVLNGLELQRELAVVLPHCPLVFISGYGDIRSSVAAMRGGAIDFIQKPFEAAELLDAVRRARRRYASLRELLMRRAVVKQRFASLTQRERQVFERVIGGDLNKQIAAGLGISEKTVKVHRARVMRKMAVRSVVMLARAAELIRTEH